MATQASSPATGKKQKILIVEDTSSIAEVLQLKLKNSGFDVDLAVNGEQGFEMIKNGEYDLVLLDIIMPKMDGFAVLESMRKKKIDIPVIITSNLGQPEDAIRARKLGVRDFFLKVELSLSEMVERIQKVLSE